MIRTGARLAATILLTALVCGCAYLPQDGPAASRIMKNASVQVENTGETLGFEYVLIDMRRDFLTHVTHTDSGSLRSIGSSVNAPQLMLGVGDVIQVTIFESETGGLFVPSDAGARPGNFVSLPSQEIDASGMITVPYAGSIRAAGNTPSAVEGVIERRLADLAIEPEAVVVIVTKNFSRVTLLGEIGASGSYELRNGGDRILDVIAQSGGIRQPPYETAVTVTRKGRSATIAYEKLVANLEENIFLVPGDSINVTEEFKRFQAFGATGAVGEFDFGKAELTLNEAIAKASGLVDSRSNPESVFIYRLEDPRTLKALGVVVPRSVVAAKSAHSHGVPTIYRVNYLQPDSFFLGQKFLMRPNDVLYVANAGSVNASKVFDVLTSSTSAATTLNSNVNALSN